MPCGCFASASRGHLLRYACARNAHLRRANCAFSRYASLASAPRYALAKGIENGELKIPVLPVFLVFPVFLAGVTGVTGATGKTGEFESGLAVRLLHYLRKMATPHRKGYAKNFWATFYKKSQKESCKRKRYDNYNGKYIACWLNNFVCEHCCGQGE